MKRVALLILAVLLAACTVPGRPAAPTAAPTLPARATATAPVPTAAARPTAAPPPASAAPSPKAAFAGVVYAREGALWAYDGQASRLLPTGGVASAPLLSPDGRRVLYRRPAAPTDLAAEPFSMWLLDLESGQETAVDLAALPAYPFELEGRTVALPRLPYLVAWMPDGQSFLFNTRVDFSLFGPGSLLSDDLWQGDAATGQVRSLLPEEEPPATFVISPDGKRLLVGRRTRIEALELSTGVRRTLLEFPAVLTYSEYAWLPEPRWLPDGRTAQVAIAPADPMQGSTYALWHLDVEEGTAEQIDQVEGMAYAWSPDGRSWSPDGTRLAYISSAGEQPQVTVMSVGRGTSGSAASVVLGETIPRILGWTPDGQTVLVQGGEVLYGIQAGPGIQSRSLVAVGAPPAQLWYGLGNMVLFTTAEGAVFELTSDGQGIQKVP